MDAHAERKRTQIKTRCFVFMFTSLCEGRAESKTRSGSKSYLQRSAVALTQVLRDTAMRCGMKIRYFALLVFHASTMLTPRRNLK